MPSFPKAARLRQRPEFQRTLDNGRKVVCARMIIYGRPRQAPDDPASQQPAHADSPDISKNSDDGDSAERPGAHQGLTRRLRLGLIVSKKVGDAVTRNRVKRHLREGFRHLEPDIAARDLDIVVIARSSAAQAVGSELQAELASCLTRLLRRPPSGGAR